MHLHCKFRRKPTESPARCIGQLVHAPGPVFAETETLRHAVEPAVYDCVRLIAVRHGSAIISGEFDQRPVSVGDIVMLTAHFPSGAEPEGKVTLTTVYLNPHYAIDQFYWQHAGILLDRFEAEDIATLVFAEPVQVLRLGEQRLGEIEPLLDELVELSQAGSPWESFARVQALWFLTADAIRPFRTIPSVQQVIAQRAEIRRGSLGHRRFAPVRAEATTVRDALHGDIARRWLLNDLAAMVHLSTKQLTRVFTRAYGKTPSGYLRLLRVKEMVRLFRETDLNIQAAGKRVGWGSRNQASKMFTRHVGITPSQYRSHEPPSTPGDVGRCAPA